MKKKISLIIISLIVLFSILDNDIFAKIDEEKIYSNYVGVYNLDNMELLYGKNHKEKIAIASITKVMTAIVSIENIVDLNEKITIDYSSIKGKVDSELVTAGIYNGQELTYYDLLCTLLISSGADSAEYLANNVLENEDQFINAMNNKAKEIGMENTSFSNVTGLDDENNYSTISDVAKMMKYAFKNETLKEIMDKNTYTTSDKNLTVRSTISKTAKRYGINIEYILGGKTGTTGDAGLCLASYSKDENVNLLVIVTGSSMYSTAPYNIIDTEYLYNEIINDYSNKNIISQGDEIYTLPTECTKQDSASIFAKEDIVVYTDVVNEEKIAIEYNGIETLDYTIKVGEKVGEISIYYNNKLVKKVDAILDEKLEFSFIKWININKKPIIILVLIVTTIIILISKTKSKKIKTKTK